ncbi:TPA: M56 family metallopeptidase [Clostridioides difficile]
MNESFKLLLSLSLSGSILAIFIFAIKPFISHKFSKSLQYYIWIIVLLRFILPFSFEENIMEKIFYKDEIQVNTNVQMETKSFKLPVDTGNNSTVLKNENSLSKKGNYDMDHDHSIYFNDMLNKYALIIWFVGAVVALGVNLIGYSHFVKHLKKTNIAALDIEKNILIDLMGRKDKIKLFRNQFVPTPMLIGIINPHIIIPDNKYNEKQIKNILLHEIAHYKRFDIIIKWIIMIITSIHWFNPLIYIIRKEVDHACELACDEFVIKKLKPSERQEYGDTLITVAAEAKYPVGVLQVTMSESKIGLKDRLASIMGYKKKTKVVIVLSIILVIGLIFGAMKLGAGRLYSEPKPPELYIGVKDEHTKRGTAIYGFMVNVEQEKNNQIEEGIVTVTYEDKSAIPEKYREDFSNHMIDLFTTAYTPYYQVKGFEVSNVKYNEKDEEIEIIFNFKFIFQNYYKDPDTVGYIKEAKENNSKHYQQLYDEYNQPKEGNDELKFTANLINGKIDINTIQVFTNIHPKGVEYVPLTIP